jgi:hypothetical protein
MSYGLIQSTEDWLAFFKYLFGGSALTITEIIRENPLSLEDQSHVMANET